MKMIFRILAALIIALILVALSKLVQNYPKSTRASTIAYSQFLNEVDNGKVLSATLSGNQVSGLLEGGRPYQTYMPNDSLLIERLHAKGVPIYVKPASD